MTSGIFGSGVSGLLAAQRALSTASHNISNVNTEGYSRQRVELGTRFPQQFGDGFVGTGVKVESIQRVFDEFAALQIRTTTSGFGQASQFFELASQIDNLLADPDAGLMPALQGFFDAINVVANDPSSIPARQVMISEANSVRDRLNYFDQRLTDLQGNINSAISIAVSDINSLAQAIADVNKQILTTSSGSGAQPNDLLDRRDELLRQMAEKVSVTTVSQDDGTVNVFIGSGQTVVAGIESRSLAVVNNNFDPERQEIAYITPQGNVRISDQVSGGELAGILRFRDEVLDKAHNELGYLAIALTATFNSQHRLGMDLSGNMGQNFFEPIDSNIFPPTAQVLDRSGNTGTPAANILVTMTDVTALTSSDYRLDRDGTNYTLTRLSDKKVTILSGFPASTVNVDGMSISLTGGNIAVGDSFLIRPVRAGARDFDVAIKDTAQIAAAVPVRTQTALSNTGGASISSGTVTDAAAYVADTYTVTMASATAATANGIVGTINDSIGTDNALQYQLLVNGVSVYSQNEGAPVLSDLDALAAVINDDLGSTGVRAIVDNVAGVLYLANEPQSSLPVTVTERLVDVNAVPLPLDAADAVTGYFGALLSGVSASNTQTFSNIADSFIVSDSSGNTESSGAYTAGSAIAFNGVEVSVSGQANAGDKFTVSSNVSGVGDNRNALILAALRDLSALEGGVSTYEDVFSRMVADVGTKTHQSDINRTAQESLMHRAIERREEVSGVNLDEEAAMILQFQQAYQAAAQVISVANTIFQTLLETIRR